MGVLKEPRLFWFDVVNGLAFQPVFEDVSNVALLGNAERVSTLDAVPCSEASAAASGGGVLGDEDGMSAKGRLLPIIGRIGGGEALLDEDTRLAEHLYQALLREVGAIGI